MLFGKIRRHGINDLRKASGSVRWQLRRKEVFFRSLLEQMKQKYASVLTAIEQQQIRLSHLHIQDNKLFIQGVAPSDQAKNKVWDQIKQVNPSWSQELSVDIAVDPNAKPAQVEVSNVSGEQQRTYTVKAGDSP